MGWIRKVTPVHRCGLPKTIWAKCGPGSEWQCRKCKRVWVWTGEWDGLDKPVFKERGCNGLG